jgi:competence protein ComEC
MGATNTAGTLAAALSGVLLGTGVQLLRPALWPAWADVVLVAWGVVALVLAWRCLRRVDGRSDPSPGTSMWRALALVFSAFMAFSAAQTSERARLRLADRLPHAMEGQDLRLQGRVVGLPHVDADGLRFEFMPESLAPLSGLGEPPHVPERVLLHWRSRAEDTDGAGWGSASAPLLAGERWELPVRLRQPHGTLNPGGFDAELWLFEQGIGAVGTVQARRPGDARRLEGPRWWHPGDRLDSLRQHWRDRILLAAGRPESVALLAALAVGDQSAISGTDWDLYRRTGIAHLVSISGMHITLFAWLAAGLVGRLWRLQPRWILWLPAPVAARWGGLLSAWGYALLAGWGVPAQRTVLMLALATLLRTIGPPWPGLWVAAVSGTLVVLLDPWALLQPGFWLSFVAVGLLIVSDSSPVVEPLAVDEDRHGWRHRWRAVHREAGAAWRAQWVVTVGLAPLTLVLFGQVSLVGWLANLVAVPVVTWVITPLALLGVLRPELWSAAAAMLLPLHDYLAWLAAGPWALWRVPAAPAWACALGMLGGLLLATPWPWSLRIWSVPLCVPLLWPVVHRPAPGRFELLAADVGQGSAVLVRTAHHLLVHDAGPAWSREGDAGRRDLVPLLQALGEPQIDELVLSHSDMDHVGGAPALLATQQVGRLRSSLPPDHPLWRQSTNPLTCIAGQHWDWDGVHFQVLHPPAISDWSRVKPNHVSCVVQVEDAQGQRALLTGDIEAEQEAALVHQLGSKLRSDVLVVPHHGSHTSSTADFLAAVQPRWAVIQVGYRSRYGHPHADVLARYQSAGITVVRTDYCGAFTWRDASGECMRSQFARYWHWKIDPDRPQVGVVVARVGSAGERE